LFRPLPVHAVLPFLGSITGIVAIVYGAQTNGKSRGEQLRRGEGIVAHGEGVWAWITFAIVVLELLILAAFLLIFLLALAAGSGSA
jgi:hypothetical protein